MSTHLRNFTVEFRSDADYASLCLPAETPKAALGAAQAICTDRHGELVFQPYELGVHEINEIVVIDHSGVELDSWWSDELILRRCAPDLLHTLRRALTALNTARCFKVPSLACDSYAIAAECSQAIAEATGTT
jgi:hypothetical protein